MSVNGLPMELLAHIFYLGTYSMSDPGAPLPFPVIASHVSRLWRSVALGSPSLWTTITFSKRRQYKCSRIWLERSKSLPIDITLKVVSDSHLSTVLDIITPHVTRWRKLDVAVDQNVFMNNVLTWLAQCASAPLLEILVLRYFKYNRGFTRSSLVPFHGNAPRLSYVTLKHVSIGWSSTLLRDLVKLELTGRQIDAWPSWVDLSRMLRESPRLTDLGLFYSSRTGPFTDLQDERIELPSLESLSLMNGDPTYVSSLFRSLSMPNLKKLSLFLYQHDFSEFVRQLTMPPQSVLSGLQYLRLPYLRTGNLFGDSGTINAIYEQLTNLKSIYLHGRSIHESFFTTLMVSFSGALYCPNLTTIITRNIPGQEMRSFITVRAMAGIPIKRIVVAKNDALNEEDERWLRENVQSFERFHDIDKLDVDVEY